MANRLQHNSSSCLLQHDNVGVDELAKQVALASRA